MSERTPITSMTGLWYTDNFGTLWGANLVDGVLIPTGEMYRGAIPQEPSSKKEMSENTPGPWSADGRFVLGAPGEGMIAAVDTDPHHCDEDALFIITACNAWHRVEALRARIAELTDKPQK